MTESQKAALSVTILDKEYRVACPPSEQAALREAACFLDEKMRSIRSCGKVIGLERIAVMAALNISHELLISQRQKVTDHADTQQHLELLLGKLDQALAMDSQ